MQRATNRPERLDGALEDAPALRAALRDLERVNRWLGGWTLSARALAALADRRPTSRKPLRVLDVGTGLADIPAALLRWAAGRGIALEVEAVDSRPEVIDAAREANRTVGGLRLAVADARSLPYPDRAFDVAHTSLMAHHLEPVDVAACLAQLRRVSGLGVIMNDLDRNRLAYVGAWLLSRMFTSSPITRNDAPLSVQRAYRAGELLTIARSVGLVEAERFRHFSGYRYAIALVLKQDPASTPKRMDGHG